MKKKRLILVTSVFPQLSETFVVNKFLGLLERGWDVHMVCGSNNPAHWRLYPELLTRPGIRRRVHVTWPHRPRWLAVLLYPAALAYCLFLNPQGTDHYGRFALQNWGFLAALRRFYLDATIIALRPDLVHFEFGALAVVRVDLKMLLGCRVTVSFRGFDLNFSGLDQPGYYQAVWQSADALHLLGQDLWQRAVRRGCPPEQPHVLIPPALEIEKWPSPEKNQAGQVGTVDRPLRILSVGRLEWKKGYDYGLQAIHLLHKHGLRCQYRIVGDGTYFEALAFARHQLVLDDCVEIIGSLQPSQVRDELAWADVFLHCAVSEGFCNAVIEAQAMRLPVVCTDADGLAENVVDGVTGFVVPRRDPKALADGLAKLAEDPLLRQNMGTAGRERVIEHFQLRDQISQFERFYKNVLENLDKTILKI